MSTVSDRGVAAEEYASEVVLIDARPALVLAQLAGADGQPYVTSQSQAGHKVLEPLADNARCSSYRVNNWLTIEADRTSGFVAVTSVDGPSLVVAFNEGVTVRPEHHGNPQIRLGPHEAFLIGVHRSSPDGQVLSAWGAEPAEHTAAADLLDRVTEVMATVGVTVGPAATEEELPPDDYEDDDTPFGRYLAEMLLTGLIITLVLVVGLLIIG